MKTGRIVVSALIAGSLVFSVTACSPEKPAKSVSHVQKKDKEAGDSKVLGKVAPKSDDASDAKVKKQAKKASRSGK